MKFTLLLSLLITASMAFAQNSDSDSETEKDINSNIMRTKSKKVERVQVTGSRIRRTDFEGPSPIKIIDRKALEDSPYNSAGDYLRELSINSFGSTRERSGSTAAGTATVSLRGLGATNTLVLMNGTRLQPDGITGAVDLNMIPEIAIESTEILKDGASAIYGSDALGGVVSFGTRKNFTGSEVSFKTTLSEQGGGNRTDVSAIAGVQRKNSNLTAAIQYRQNEALNARDRSFSRASITRRGDGTKQYVGYSQTAPVAGYINADGNWALVPGTCGTGDGTDVEVLGSDTFCRYPYADEATTLPETEQVSGYFNGEWTPTSRDTFNTTAIVSQNQTQWSFAPSPGRNFIIPADVAATINQGQPLPNTTPGEDVRLSYRLAELGNRTSQIENTAFNINSQYAREFGETWEWGTTVSYGTSRRVDDSISGYALQSELNRIIADGSYNPFDENRTFEQIRPAFYQPQQITTSTNYTVDTNINGELFEIGNTPINIATGVVYNRMEYTDAADAATVAGEVFGSAGSIGGGERDIYSAYSEISIPIGQFETQIAARFDQYSDFGSALSPKFATKWRPNKKFMVRASVGEGFRAPLMQSLYLGQSQGFPFIVDQFLCNQEKENNVPGTPSCIAQQYEETTGGNTELDAEETVSYGIGAIFEPVRGFLLGADFWHLDQSNVIGTANIEDITRAQIDDFGLPNRLGIEINRNPTTQRIESITNPITNLADREVTGLDLQARFTIPSPIGKFTFNDEHSIMMQYKESGYPGAPLQERLDLIEPTSNTPYRPKWRNVLTVAYSPNRGNTFGLTYNSTAGVQTIDRQGRLPSYGEVDITYSASLPWKATLTAGVKNVSGKTPPFDPGDASGLNSALYQQIGRYGFLNYRQSF